MAYSARTALNSSTATRVIPAAGASTNLPEASVVIKNSDASIVIYLGDSNVTSATGLDLAGGASIVFPPGGYPEGVYAIAASGTPTVAVLKA